MTMDTLHPDQLEPGHMVGPFRILEVLGAGNFGRVFKAERDGGLYALKMALRPACAERRPGEEDVDGRLAREAAALEGCLDHPSFLAVESMDFWPHARGYRYLTSRYVEADTFTEWLHLARPSPAQLVQVFGVLVSAVGHLHEQGVHHRDLKGDNVLVTRGRQPFPLVIDLGAAFVPGASRLTVGLPPGTLHMLPPEAVAFVRDELWKEGARFEEGAAMDLYALGHLLYEALTGHHVFDPKLPTDELLAAIETVVPRAPHYLNPRVPRALSDIALRLLAKSPEERYESTQALGQTLWEAAKQEHGSRAWHERLEWPPGGAAPVTPQEAEEREAQQRELARQLKESRALRAQVVRELENVISLVEQARSAEPPAPPRHRRWPLVLAALVTLLALAGGLALRFTLAPPPLEKGHPSVSTQTPPQHAPPSLEASRSAPAGLLAALLCTLSGFGCAGAQVKLPPTEPCPKEALDFMFGKEGQEMDLQSARMETEIDVSQPATGEFRYGHGTYNDGPIVGRIIVSDRRDKHGVRGTGLPVGTLLYGRIWTGPGLITDSIPPSDAVVIRYTEALLPDGRKLPVCLTMTQDGWEQHWPVNEGSKPGSFAHLPRTLFVRPVDHWKWD